MERTPVSVRAGAGTSLHDRIYNATSRTRPVLRNGGRIMKRAAGPGQYRKSYRRILEFREQIVSTDSRRPRIVSRVPARCLSVSRSFRLVLVLLGTPSNTTVLGAGCTIPDRDVRFYDRRNDCASKLGPRAFAAIATASPLNACVCVCVVNRGQ